MSDLENPKSDSEPDSSSYPITPGVVYGEVRDFIRSHEQRRRQVPRAALVGLVAGLLAVAFRWTLDVSDLLRDRLIVFAHQFPSWGYLLPILLGAAGAGSGVALVRGVAPEASGSGIPHLKAVLHHLRGMQWRRILPVKFVGGVLCIGSGMTMGREGPTVQMGGAIGQMVGQWLGVTPRERQSLIAAGAGAGLAAAFNAPLSGLIFVLEEVQRDFTPTVFTASFVAAIVADVVARLFLGQFPVFHVTNYPTPPLTALPAFLILGILAGVLGVVFNRSLLGGLSLFARFRLPAGIRAAFVGAAIGGVGWFLPDVLGGGHRLVENALNGHVTLMAIPFFFLLRFLLTMASYSTGAPGGIFAPLLVLGALIGLGVGDVTQQFFPHQVSYSAAFAVVGMAAYFTAIVRAPLTGIVLIVEMTGNYQQMLPLLVACLSAYAVADLLGDLPIYEALLERDLLRSQEAPKLEETLLLDLTVSPGSPFAGQKVRDLGLPPGCILVTVRKGLREEVPTAETRLETGDRITVVIAPDAAHAVSLLRHGTESP